MRGKGFAVVVAASVVVAGGGVAAVSADEAGEPAAVGACLGLTCAGAGDSTEVPEARQSAPSVAGPARLEKQEIAGFYEYGQGTSLGKRAVAYVVPAGQSDRMPASVRDLPVVRALAEGGDFKRGTVVIFGPEASLSVASDTAIAGVSRHKKRSRKRARARMAAQDAYGCEDNYFCLYDGTNFEIWGKKVQFGPFYTGTGWHRLGDYAFNDLTSSMRNRRDRDSLLARHWPAGSSTRYCADSHSSDTTLSNNAIGDGQASSFANVPDDIHC